MSEEFLQRHKLGKAIVATSQTYDKMADITKATYFVMNGGAERITEHQVHGIRFEMSSKKDDHVGDKKFINVVIFEYSTEGGPYPPKQEVRVDLIELVHAYIDTKTKK